VLPGGQRFSAPHSPEPAVCADYAAAGLNSHHSAARPTVAIVAFRHVPVPAPRTQLTRTARLRIVLRTFIHSLREIIAVTVTTE